MKKEINNSKGITLITLIITVMVLAILTSVAVYSGIEVLNSSKLTRFTTEMKLIQTRVNEIYDDRDNYENKGQDASSYSTQLSSIASAIGSDFTTWGYSSDISNYRYYTKEKLKEDLDVEDVEQDVLIDLYNRKIISVNGTTVDGQTYYVLEQLPNSVYNVEYEGGFSVLPKEYQAVEYIESTGVEYINTGVTPKNGFGFWIDVMPLTEISKSATSSKIFGSSKRNNGTWGGVELATYPAAAGGQMTWFKGNNFYDPGFESYTRCQMSDINNHFESSTGKSYDTPYVNNINICGDLYLLAIHQEDGAYANGLGSRLYGCKLYNGEDIIRDFIPCYCTETVTDIDGNSCLSGTIGLYDLVEEEFYTNKGAGAFGKGSNKNLRGQIIPTFDVSSTYIGDNKYHINVSNIVNNGEIEKWIVKYKMEGQDYWNTSKNLNFVVDKEGKYKVKIVNGDIESSEDDVCARPIPSKFQAVEYIESRGGQYIDTGILCSQDMSCEITNTFEQLEGTQLFGAYASPRRTHYGIVNDFMYMPSTENNTTTEHTFKTDVNYHTYYLSSSTYKYDNTIIASGKFQFANNLKFFLFARNNSGTITNYCKSKLSNAKIWNDNNIVRDFIPCYCIEEVTDVDDNTCPAGTIGLYDIAQGGFYTNKGTGTFVIPE